MSDQLAASERSLGIRGRRDLRSERIVSRRLSGWNVKDPLSLRVYQMRDEEYFILGLLDGARSLSEIKRLVEERFSPRKLSPRHLRAFVGLLHREGLAVADAPGQGRGLARRLTRRSRGRWWAMFANPLAIRFRGIDPTRLLDLLYPRLAWCFRPWALASAVLLMLTALLVVAAAPAAAIERLPDVANFGTRHLVILASAIGLMKVAHELGHALACRHFGGSCHELGMMLLVGVPCLYCNVTDAWMMSGKWRRIAVSGAGIFVDLTLAAVCALLWRFTEPGTLNQLCLSLMLVGSINTLLLNGNPLLKFDGYFVLADLLEVPNLQQQAFSRLRALLARLYFGRDVAEGGFRAAELGGRFLLVYAVASLIYRVVLVACILWFCHRLLARHGLAPIGMLLTGIVLAGLAAAAVAPLVASVGDPVARRRFLRRRFLLSAALTALLVGLLLAVPMPYRIKAPLITRPSRPTSVRVTVPGTLEWAVAAGARVSQGDPVARLRNPELEQEVAELKSQVARQAKHVEGLKRQLHRPEVGQRLPAAEQLLGALTDRLAERQAYRGRLTITAPRNGVVLPPPRVEADVPDDRLPEWQGTPLETENLGSLLREDTLLCVIAPPDRFEVSLFVGQSRVDFVREGQPLRARLFSRPGHVMTGRVSHVARVATDDPPRELIATGQIAMEPGAAPPRPVEAVYEVRGVPDDARSSPPVGATGHARVTVTPQSLGRRLLRWLNGLFRFA